MHHLSSLRRPADPAVRMKFFLMSEAVYEAFEASCVFPLLVYSCGHLAFRDSHHRRRWCVCSIHTRQRSAPPTTAYELQAVLGSPFRAAAQIGGTLLFGAHDFFHGVPIAPDDCLTASSLRETVRNNELDSYEMLLEDRMNRIWMI